MDVSHLSAGKRKIINLGFIGMPNCDLLVSKRFPIERIYGVNDPEVARLYEEHKQQNPVK